MPDKKNQYSYALDLNFLRVKLDTINEYHVCDVTYATHSIPRVDI